MRRQLRKGRAAVLAFYPPEQRLPDAGIEATAYTSGSSELSGTWAAALTADSLSQPLSATGLRGARTISVGDASDVVVGERYLLQAHDGRIVPVEVLGKNSGHELALADQLPFAFETTGDGSTLRGWRHELALSASQLTSRRRNVRVELSYEIDSRTIEHVEYFDIVAIPFAVPLDEAYLELFWPQFGQHSAEAEWRRIAEGVVYETVYNALLGADLEPDKVRNPAGLRPWVAALIIEATIANRLAVRAEGLSEALLTYWQKRAQAERDNVFSAKHLWYDQNDDLSGATGSTAAYVDSDGDWIPVDPDDVWSESSELGLPIDLVPVS